MNDAVHSPNKTRWFAALLPALIAVQIGQTFGELPLTDEEILKPSSAGPTTHDFDPNERVLLSLFRNGNAPSILSGVEPNRHRHRQLPRRSRALSAADGHQLKYVF